MKCVVTHERFCHTQIQVLINKLNWNWSGRMIHALEITRHMCVCYRTETLKTKCSWCGTNSDTLIVSLGRTIQTCFVGNFDDMKYAWSSSEASFVSEYYDEVNSVYICQHFITIYIGHSSTPFLTLAHFVVVFICDF